MSLFGPPNVERLLVKRDVKGLNPGLHRNAGLGYRRPGRRQASPLLNPKLHGITMPLLRVCRDSIQGVETW